MDLRDHIMREHSKAMKDLVVKYVGRDQRRFDTLASLVFSGDYELARRASWPMSEAAVLHPSLVDKHWTAMVRVLEDPANHHAVKRHMLRIMDNTEVPGRNAAKVLDACYRFIRDESAPVAVRAFSITAAASICSRYPDLIGEYTATLAGLSTIPLQPALSVRIKRAIRSLAF